MKLRHLFVTLTLLLTCSVVQAQPPGLTKEGDTFRHEPSKSSVKVNTKDWEILDTKGTVKQPHIALRKAFGGTDVVITWTKIEDKITFDEAVELEMNQLVQSYGKDKVAKKDPITIENKSVSVIELSDGPDRDGKNLGVIYLLSAGPDANERWKVKIRAIVNKANETAGKAAVSDLLRQFQW